MSVLTTFVILVGWLTHDHDEQVVSRAPFTEGGLNAAAYTGGTALLVWAVGGNHSRNDPPVHIVTTTDQLSVLRAAAAGCHHLRIEYDVEVYVHDPHVVESVVHRQLESTEVPAHLDRLDQQYLPLDNKYDPGPSSGNGSIIYVLDSGIAAHHPEFSGRVLAGWSVGCHSGNEAGCGADWFFEGLIPEGAQCSGHGTACASVAAGVNFGVAPHALVKSVQVLSCGDTGSVRGVNEGAAYLRPALQHSSTPALQLALHR